MKCPICGSKTYVIDTRPSDTYEYCLRRRRLCWHCKHRFTTYEIMPEYLESGERAKELLKQINEFVAKCPSDRISEE